MTRFLPADVVFELKRIFLHELAESHQGALAAKQRLQEDATDRDSIEVLCRYFHRIAGTAKSVGFPVVGHLAAGFEGVAWMALEGDVAPGPRIAEILCEGVHSVSCFLEAGDSPALLRAEGDADGDPAPAGAEAESAASLEMRASVWTPSARATDGTPEESFSRILVVDDDPVSARLIADCLKSAGFRSSYCCEPEDTLRVVQAELPDLIILDVVMPGMDGFELCQRVRAHPALSLTPIIFVTRRGDVDQRVRGLEMGGNDYIAKPFDPQELIARVRSHLGRLSALKDMAIRDGLTRCFNHKYFKSRLDQEINRARASGTSLCLAMLDVDFFKKINDQYGHPAGDSVLVHLANLLMASVRTSDMVARYGGEEFAILLTHAGATEASVIANRICKRVAQYPFPGVREDEPLKVTISIGLTELAPHDDLQSFLVRADAALYEAKARGRNQVRIATAAEAAN